MDLTEFLAKLCSDLKMTLGTEISEGEAIRCIERAVDDLSRHMPRERIYELTWVEAVTDDDFTTPATADPDYIVDAYDLKDKVDGQACTLTATPWLDVPRPVAISLTDADNSVTRMTLIVKGLDADGVYREERFYRHNGKSQTGKVYFTYIYEVEINEITGNSAVVATDVLDVGTAAPDTASKEVWIQLDNPVEPGSESVYSGASKTGTKYTLNTDYEMDYANGRIRMKSGGSLAVATTYYANYKRHNLMVDVSAILPELMRIIKVVYPADKTPEQQVAFSIWENMLIIGSQRPGESQKALVDKEHIAIYYETRHTPPTYVGPGSYPEYLDQVVLIGASGYALLVEALQYELQAAGDLTSLGTELTDGSAGADELLETGDDTINRLNDGGPTVPDKYADYARARVVIAQLYASKAENGLLLADRYRAEAINRLVEFHDLLKSKAEYRKRIVDVSVRQPK